MTLPSPSTIRRSVRAAQCPIHFAIRPTGICAQVEIAQPFPLDCPGVGILLAVQIRSQSAPAKVTTNATTRWAVVGKAKATGSITTNHASIDNTRFHPPFGRFAGSGAREPRASRMA
jgi:hypothetical protein